MADAKKIIEIILKLVDQGATTGVDKFSRQMDRMSTAANQAQQSLAKIDAFKELKKQTADAQKAWKDAESGVKKLAAEMKTASGDTAKLQKAFETAKKDAKALKTEYEQNQKALSGLRTALRSAGVDITKLSTEQSRLRKELKASQESLKALQAVAKARDALGVKSFEQLRGEIKKTTQAYDTLRKSGKVSADELKRAYAEMQAKTKALTGEMAGLNNQGSQLSAAFGALAKVLAGAMAIALPVKEAAEFERAMAEVLAISGATGEEFGQLTAVALEMGRTTEYTAVQAAEGLKYLSMAGLSASQSMVALPSVLQLAQAGAMDLGRAADITTNIMTGFGLKAEELGRVNDVLVQTFTHTNSTLEELGTAFTYVGPIAAGLGVDFNDLAATLGVLHNAGIKGSMAGTALRGVLDTMFNPTKAEAAQLEALEERLGGVSLQIRDSSGKFIGFTSLIQQMEKANLNAAEALKLTGLRAGPGFAALIAVGSHALEEFVELNRQAEGRAEKIAAVMKDNTVGAFRELTSAVSGLNIRVGNELLPTVEAAIRFVTDLVASLQDWMDTHPKLTSGLVKSAAGVTALVTVMAAAKVATIALTIAKGQLITKLATLAPSLAASSGAFAALGGAVSSALGVIVAAFAGWSAGRFIGQLTAPFDAAGRSIDELVQTGYAKLGTFFNWLTGADNTANQSVIDGIKKQAEARTYKTQTAEIEAQREIALAKEIKAATAEVTRQIEETHSAWKEVGTRLTQVQTEYDNFVSGASDSLKGLGDAIDASVNAVWENVDSGAAVTALEAQLAELNRVYDMSDQERIAKATDIENQIAAARVAAIQSAATATVGLLEAQQNRELALASAKYDTEVGIIDKTSRSEEEALSRRKAAQEKHDDEVRGIGQQTLEKKKELFEKATEALKKELDASLAKEKSIADEISSVNKQVADSKMSSEDKIRALRQKSMTAEAAYNDQVAQVREKIAQAAQLAQTDTQASIALYKEAQGMAAGLGNAVSDGTKEVVSQQFAVNTAIDLVKAAQSGLEQAAKTRASALDSSLEATKDNTDAVKTALDSTKTSLDAVTSQAGKNIALSIDVDASKFEADLTKLTEKREMLVNVNAEFSKVSADLDALNVKKYELMKETSINVNANFDKQIADLDAMYGKVKDLSETEQTVNLTVKDDVSDTVDTVTEKVSGLESSEITLTAKDDASATVDSVVEKVSGLENSEVALTIDDQASANIDAVKDKVDSLSGNADVKINVDTSQSLGKINEVTKKLEALDGKTYTSYHKVESKMEASSAKPTTEKIKELEEKFAGMKSAIEKPVRQNISMTGDAGDGLTPLTAAIGKVSKLHSDLKSKIEREEITGRLTWGDQQGALTLAADMAKSAIQSVSNAMSTASSDLSAYGDDFEDVMTQNADAAKSMMESAIADGEAMIQALSSRIADLGNQIKSIESELAGVGDSTQEKIRKLNQGLMDDYQKYLDDKTRAEELYNQATAEMQAGNYDAAKTLMLQSQDLAASLAREVKDANGEVIVSIADSTAAAKQMVVDAGAGAEEALAKQKAALQGQQDAAREELSQTEAMVDSMQGVLENFTSSFETTMQAMTDQIAAMMAEVKATVEEPMTPEVDTDPVKAAFAEMASEAGRTVALLTVQAEKLASQQNYISRSLLEGVNAQLAAAKAELNDYKYKAGMYYGGEVRGYFSGGPVLHASTGLGVPIRYASGRLPGTDNRRDEVPVMARHGEWFVHNEGVDVWRKKVGGWFMHGVNKPWSNAGQIIQRAMAMAKTVGNPASALQGAAKMFYGGQVAQGFATGGTVINNNNSGMGPDMGSLSLSINNRGGKIFGKADVLKVLHEELSNARLTRG